MANIFEADPGRRNVVLQASTPSEYFFDYAREIAEVAQKVDRAALDRFTKVLLEGAERKANIFVAGNGGSAAIADHLGCDFAKGTYHHKHAPLRPISLSANVSLYTALANDFGFETVFSGSLDIYAESKDILIAISSSGNSENIVKAVQAAKAKEMTTIGLTGFAGGEVRKLVDISLHVPAQNYGLVEDCHQMIMHSAAQFITIQRRRDDQ